MHTAVRSKPDISLLPVSLALSRAVHARHRRTYPERLRVDQHEGNARALVAAVRPGMVSAALDHDIAGPQLDRRLIHVHLDLALDDDDVVECLGAVHMRL